MPYLFMKSILLTAIIVVIMEATNEILQKSEFARDQLISIGIVVALALIVFTFVAIRQNRKPTHSS